MQTARQAMEAGAAGERVLYHCAHSTCSQKVRLCLAEKQLTFRSHLLSLRRLEHLDPAYLQLNPNGVVPTLVDGGIPIIDSSVICEYLDETCGGPSLTPQDPVARARMRAWMRFLEEVPTAAIRIPSINRLFAGLMQAQGAAWDDAKRRTPLRGELYRRVGRDGFNAAETDESLQRLRLTLERADAALATGNWLVGSAISLADLVLLPTLVRMEDLDLATMWGDLPQVASWYRRMTARPSFATAFFAGSRLTPSTIDQIY